MLNSDYTSQKHLFPRKKLDVEAVFHAKLEAERTKAVLDTVYLKRPVLSTASTTSSNEQAESSAGKRQKHKPQPGKRSCFKRRRKDGTEYSFFWNSKYLPKEGKRLSKYDAFKELLPSRQKAILLFYKQRGHSNLSLNEMGFLFGCSDVQASAWKKDLTAKGLITSEKRYLKDRNGKVSKRHARSYTSLTTKGSKWFKEEVLGEFFKTVFPDEEVFSSLKNELLDSNEVSTHESEVPETQKKFKKDLRGLGHKGVLRTKECQEEPAGSSGNLSTEGKNEENQTEQADLSGKNHRPVDLSGNAYHCHLEASLDSHHQQEGKKEKTETSATEQLLTENFAIYSTKTYTEIEKLFIEYGFSHELPNFHHKAIEKLCQENQKTIAKNLKLVRKKLAKGFRMQSFVKFFTYLMKTSKKGKGAKKWFGKLTDDYSDALAGKSTPGTKKLYDGKSTSTIIASFAELEKETGQKLTRKNMGELVRHNSFKLETSLNQVLYRMKLGGVKMKKDEAPRKGAPIYQEHLVEKDMLIFNPKTGKEETRKMKVKERLHVGHRLLQEKECEKVSTTKGEPIYIEKWITKTVEVFSPKFGGNVTKEVRESKKLLVGHKINLNSLLDGAASPKYKKVRSWIGLLFSTLKLPNIEAIMELRKSKAKESVAGATI